MYQINICSPLYDSLPDGSVNTRATRILFAIDLLLLCLTYNCLSFFLKKQVNDLRLEDKESNHSIILRLEHSLKKWQRDYLLSFGDHVVALGFVMTFSPYQFQLVLALFFMVVTVLYQVRLHKWAIETTYCKTGMRIINMTLLLCAMVGLSRTGFDSFGKCQDSVYQIV